MSDTQVKEVITQPDSEVPVSLEGAMDAAFESVEADPDPKSVEPSETNVTETEKSEIPSVDSGSDAGVTTKEPADKSSKKTTYTLTPEEEHLLRRNRSTEEDLAFYRSLDNDQRIKALRPLRESQKDKDRFWGLPKEERARLAQESTLPEGGQSVPDATETSLRESFRVPSDRLKKIADKEGISVESLTELTDALASQIAGRVTPIVRELDSVRQRDAASDANRAISSVREELVKSFPDLKDDATWNGFLNDEDTVAFAEAKMARNGGNRSEAIRAALTSSVRNRYFDKVQTQSRTRQAQSRTSALKGTSEPSGSGRGAAAKAPPAKSLDEAMDRVFDEA